ncbi:hypothetical protein [Pseudochryseolinea flava]|uniref:Uncharacterized protein n=1 Tax=Pseudochryseolinea flava TaxID=2059302 RepID=A0A364Y4J2_9BACT|nr:hypothetical protein [Pseudochryseolinea flava]RAW01733.1 hypothetical protein DQQ10_08780 [Pseudochryseolinea flava]
MKKQIDLKALTLIFGIIIALIVFFTVWFINPENSQAIDLTLDAPKPFDLKQFASLVIQSLF